MLPEMKPLERRINAGLSAELPRWLTKRPQRLAVDLTLIPYHGEPFLDPQEIYRSQPKSGTTHFHAYASCCVVEHGQRFTLAMRWVAKDESLKETLQQLLKQVRLLDVSVRFVLLDREFYSVNVIRYLQASQTPFLMPVAHRGRKPADPEDVPWNAAVPFLEEEQLLEAHAAKCRRSPGDYSYLCLLPQLRRPPETSWPQAVGVCVLGLSARSACVGPRRIPQAVRHRDQLPTNEPVPHPHLHSQPGSAAAVCWDCPFVAKRLDLVSLARSVRPPPQWPLDIKTGTAPPDDADAEPATCRRTPARMPRRPASRNTRMATTYDRTTMRCITWNY